MAYLHIDRSFWTHRKLKRFARAVGLRPTLAAGLVERLWDWAMDNVPASGDLTGLDGEDLADAGDWDGDPSVYVDALIHAGFIDVIDDVRYLHDWPEYGGRVKEDRNRRAAHMRNVRAQQRGGRVTDTLPSRDSNVTDTLPSRDPSVTALPIPIPNPIPNPNPNPIPIPNEESEELREEVLDTHTDTGERAQKRAGVRASNKQQLPPEPVDYSPSFLAWWAGYPKKRKKVGAFRAWEELNPDDALVQVLTAGVARDRDGDWAELDDPGRFVPLAENWLRDRRWEDEEYEEPDYQIGTPDEIRRHLAGEEPHVD